LYYDYLRKSWKERDYLVSAEEKGREEGLQKGREERNLEIARSMLGDKEPIEKTMKWTGLSKLEIEALLPLWQES
jgi:predicted transposase/invertase (TIGR01784 family)